MHRNIGLIISRPRPLEFPCTDLSEMQGCNAPRKFNFPGNKPVGFSRNPAFYLRGQTRGSGVMELFLGEKIADFEGETSKICRFCGEKLKLVRTMVASGSGRIVHMFECRCGQRTWED